MDIFCPDCPGLFVTQENFDVLVVVYTFNGENWPVQLKTGSFLRVVLFVTKRYCINNKMCKSLFRQLFIIHCGKLVVFCSSCSFYVASRDASGDVSSYSRPTIERLHILTFLNVGPQNLGSSTSIASTVTLYCMATVALRACVQAEGRISPALQTVLRLFRNSSERHQNRYTAELFSCN